MSPDSYFQHETFSSLFPRGEITFLCGKVSQSFVYILTWRGGRFLAGGDKGKVTGGESGGDRVFDWIGQRVRDYTGQKGQKG